MKVSGVCQNGEVVVRKSSIKKGLVEKGTLAKVLSCKFWEIFKNTFFYRTPVVAASESEQEDLVKMKKNDKWGCNGNRNKQWGDLDE